MSEQREFVSAGRTTIITESGIDTGIDYVLVHGIGMGHRYWSEFAEALGRTGRVFALDLPGFGDAPEPDEPLDIAASGDLIAEIVAHEGLQRSVLVGHSMGTEIVVEAAARHPEFADRVVLIAPTVNPRERTAAKQAVRMLQDVSMSKPKVMALGLMYYLKAGPRWYVKKLGTMLEHHVEDSLPKVTAPVLVLRGRTDTVVPDYWARDVTRLVPDGRYIEVDGHGHEAMITGGVQIAKLVAEHAGTTLPDDDEIVAAPPLTVLGKAGIWAADYLYAGSRQLVSLFRRRPPARYLKGDRRKPVIVLLPGVYETWVFMAPIAERLSKAGYRVSVVYGMKHNRRPIVDTSRMLQNALTRVHVPSAGRIIVAHSKGGLIGKHLMSEADLGVRGMVTLCTPFTGSKLARYAVGRTLREFGPTNGTITELAGRTSVNERITSLSPSFDPHVPGGSALDGARNIALLGAGHFLTLASEEAADTVLTEVSRLADREA
ncbi:alpha/beta hydrolase [Microbacterium sp. MPKO10]|uniref:alpha/beta hydrolase n=1 Tax=Microbacterium sp. MPKO10 TaxID=2989818 RepID=UPI002236C1A7|nr:alpha/beta hydrolase [Microbacterium sp. MPKO10]MCW4457135.1 alpha/beta hydrolase [Microbacterium sp. MPKO10]